MTDFTLSQDDRCLKTREARRVSWPIAKNASNVSL